jgi:hypothetical protein
MKWTLYSSARRVNIQYVFLPLIFLQVFFIALAYLHEQLKFRRSWLACYRCAVH